MGLPTSFRAGDTVEWVEPSALSVDSTSWTLAGYLRKGTAGITVTGVARSDGGWDMSLTATQTGGMAAGTWSYQSLAANGAARTTLDSRTAEVLPSLAYTGTPAAFDGRSETEIELAEVRAAIRLLITNRSAQYTIGSRSFTALDLGKLTERESQLRAIVAREKAAARVAAGLGDPRNCFVRFG